LGSYGRRLTDVLGVTCVFRRITRAYFFRLLQPDGSDGGYVEAEYICNPGYRLVAFSTPARLLCKGSQWIGAIPMCEAEPQVRRCSHKNGECQHDCRDDALGRAVCSCRPGYALVGETNCEGKSESKRCGCLKLGWVKVD